MYKTEYMDLRERINNLEKKQEEIIETHNIVALRQKDIEEQQKLLVKSVSLIRKVAENAVSVAEKVGKLTERINKLEMHQNGQQEHILKM